MFDTGNSRIEYRSLPFVEKFIEIHHLMLKELFFQTDDILYPVSPISWPFVREGESFWENRREKKEIYLVGNIVTWWLAITGIMLYAVLFIIDRACLQRDVDLMGST